jgi:hypothetical protein
MSRKSTVGAKRLVANQLMCGAQWSNLKRPRYQMDIAGVFGMSSDRCRSRLKRCSCRTDIARVPIPRYAALLPLPLRRRLPRRKLSAACVSVVDLASSASL